MATWLRATLPCSLPAGSHRGRTLQAVVQKSWCVDIDTQWERTSPGKKAGRERPEPYRRDGDLAMHEEGKSVRYNRLEDAWCYHAPRLTSPR